MAPQKSLGVLKLQTKRGHPPAPRTLIPGPKIVIPDLIGDPESVREAMDSRFRGKDDEGSRNGERKRHPPPPEPSTPAHLPSSPGPKIVIPDLIGDPHPSRHSHGSGNPENCARIRV